MSSIIFQIVLLHSTAQHSRTTIAARNCPLHTTPMAHSTFYAPSRCCAPRLGLREPRPKQLLHRQCGLDARAPCRRSCSAHRRQRRRRHLPRARFSRRRRQRWRRLQCGGGGADSVALGQSRDGLSRTLHRGAAVAVGYRWRLLQAWRATWWHALELADRYRLVRTGDRAMAVLSDTRPHRQHHQKVACHATRCARAVALAFGSRAAGGLRC